MRFEVCGSRLHSCNHRLLRRTLHRSVMLLSNIDQQKISGQVPGRKNKMKHINYKFSGSSTDCYFAYGISHLKEIVDKNNTILVTDENVFNAHTKRFKGWNTIVLKPGEEFKVQATVDAVIEQLIAMKADRKTTLVGVGGGVITDITGYVAAVYMRGIAFGFIPTSLLALVDASIGGKNGIDVGVYKNMVGVIRQPKFILQDMVFSTACRRQNGKTGLQRSSSIPVSKMRRCSGSWKQIHLKPIKPKRLPSVNWCNAMHRSK